MTSKTGQKKPLKNFFVLCIYDTVNDIGRLPNAKRLGVTKQNISYHARKLLKAGIIRKKTPSSGIYETLVDRKEAIRLLGKRTKEIIVGTKKSGVKSMRFKRVHNIQATITLPKFDYWFKIMGNYLSKKGINYTINKKNQYSIDFMYKGLSHKIKLCKESILLYIPTGKDFISDDVDLAVNLARSYIKRVMSSFCGYFGKDLRVKGDFKLKISRRHIAMMDNDIARKVQDEREQVEVYVGGKLRVITDNSFNFNELEAVNNVFAMRDVKKMERLIEETITIGLTPNDIKKSTDVTVQGIMDKLKEYETLLSQNVELVGKVITNCNGNTKAIANIMGIDNKVDSDNVSDIEPDYYS